MKNIYTKSHVCSRFTCGCMHDAAAFQTQCCCCVRARAIMHRSTNVYVGGKTCMSNSRNHFFDIFFVHYYLYCTTFFRFQSATFQYDIGFFFLSFDFISFSFLIPYVCATNQWKETARQNSLVRLRHTSHAIRSKFDEILFCGFSKFLFRSSSYLPIDQISSLFFWQDCFIDCNHKATVITIEWEKEGKRNATIDTQGNSNQLDWMQHIKLVIFFCFVFFISDTAIFHIVLDRPMFD